jgi:hypothetical protein
LSNIVDSLATGFLQSLYAMTYVTGRCATITYAFPIVVVAVIVCIDIAITTRPLEADVTATCAAHLKMTAIPALSAFPALCFVYPITSVFISIVFKVEAGYRSRAAVDARVVVRYNFIDNVSSVEGGDIANPTAYAEYSFGPKPINSS